MIDIAPLFKEVIEFLPLESLNEIEEILSDGNSKVLRLAIACIRAEKERRV